jgi:hypothetical protein
MKKITASLAKFFTQITIGVVAILHPSTWPVWLFLLIAFILWAYLGTRSEPIAKKIRRPLLPLLLGLGALYLFIAVLDTSSSTFATLSAFQRAIVRAHYLLPGWADIWWYAGFFGMVLLVYLAGLLPHHSLVQTTVTVAGSIFSIFFFLRCAIVEPRIDLLYRILSHEFLMARDREHQEHIRSYSLGQVRSSLALLPTPDVQYYRSFFITLEQSSPSADARARLTYVSCHNLWKVTRFTDSSASSVWVLDDSDHVQQKLVASQHPIEDVALQMEKATQADMNNRRFIQDVAQLLAERLVIPADTVISAFLDCAVSKSDQALEKMALKDTISMKRLGSVIFLSLLETGKNSRDTGSKNPANDAFSLIADWQEREGEYAMEDANRIAAGVTVVRAAVKIADMDRAKKQINECYTGIDGLLFDVSLLNSSIYPPSATGAPHRESAALDSLLDQVATTPLTNMKAIIHLHERLTSVIAFEDKINRSPDWLREAKAIDKGLAATEKGYQSFVALRDATKDIQIYNAIKFLWDLK